MPYQPNIYQSHEKEFSILINGSKIGFLFCFVSRNIYSNLLFFRLSFFPFTLVNEEDVKSLKKCIIKMPLFW